jgi:hypothetical protein
LRQTARRPDPPATPPVAPRTIDDPAQPETRRLVHPPRDIAAEHQRILKEIEQLTPAQWFEEWTYRYRPMTERGFAVYENRLHPIVEHQVTHKRMIQNVLLTIAGALSAIALLAALWPTGNKTRRPGGRETRS